jgi:asparagine synthase (glutamine-hydrolysing)
MSAQAGVCHFDGSAVEPISWEKLKSEVAVFGPDGAGEYTSDSAAIVHRAFHTTPESRNQHQPLVTSHGHVITLDGHLDNREDLVDSLPGPLNSKSADVTIVEAALQRWGSDCFRRFVGDWAISLWRPEEHALLLAVDYMSVCHIFYSVTNNCVRWCTDLTPLVVLSGQRFEIDDEYVAGYFANDPLSYLTPYRQIRQVPPGHFVVIRNAQAKVLRYWTFSPQSRIQYKQDTEYEDHFRQLFRQSVRRRLRSDSSVLAELSGGLDSSCIVCVADDILAREEALTPRLDTLSFFDKSEPKGDDWLFFPKIEEKRGRAGIHIDATNFNRPALSFRNPCFSAMPQLVGVAKDLSSARANLLRNGGYRVILSGLGGDEFMGGIPDPTAHLGDLMVQFRLISLYRQLIAWSLVKRRPWIQLFGRALLNFLPASVGKYCFKEGVVEPWINKDFARHFRISARQLGVAEHFGLFLPTRRSYASGVLQMAQKLAKLRISGQALEEVRYPFLDQNLIEFVLSIPASQLLRPGHRRSLMRRSLVGIVPQEILDRRTKQFGARTPIVDLENHWDEIRAAFDSPMTSRFGYVDGDCFLKKLQGARGGKEIHITRMLKTISLEFFLRDLAERGLIVERSNTTEMPAPQLVLRADR